MTNAERKERQLGLFLKEMGGDPAVTNFLSEYTNINIRHTYAQQLVLYRRHLRSKGITTTYTEMMKDNLRCLAALDPTDVITKTRHLSWLKEYLNVVPIGEKASESKRKTASQAVRMFYRATTAPSGGITEWPSRSPRPSPTPWRSTTSGRSSTPCRPGCGRR